MTENPTPTPNERGKRLVKVFDAVTDRLLKELEDPKEFKASLLTNAIDLLRFAEFSPRDHVIHDHPSRTLQEAKLGRLGLIIEETERRRLNREAGTTSPDSLPTPQQVESSLPFRTP